MSTFFQKLTDHPLTEVVVWTLVHFLWQGLLIAVVVAILLICLRRASAATRYLLACGGLALMALAPMFTASWLTAAMQEAREPQISNAIDNSFAIDRSQAEMLRIPLVPVADNLALHKPAVALPQDADSKTLNAAGIAWRETLRKSFPYFVVLWSLGVLLLSLRLLGGLWRVQQWRRRGIAIKTAELKETTARLSAVMGLKRKFELLESAQAVVPAVIGWLKPAVIVPTSLISGLSPAELESLLAHELAHIRRHDFLVNLLQTVIETVLFYHPAVWWLSSAVRCERENCCDDLAVAACGNRIVFARALAKMEELRCGDPRLALSARGGSLLGRVQRLLAPSAANRADVWWPAGALVLGAIALALSSLFLAVATAESNHQQNADKAAKQDPQKSIPQVPMPFSPTPPSLKPDRSFKVESSPGDEGPARADQSGVKVLASHTYNSASRQSTHFIPLNDTSVPVDQGIEYQGVAIYLTLMFDLVAVDARSGEVLWYRDWSKSHPFWKTVSVVELGNGADSKLAVELFAPVPKTNEMAYLYLGLKTGTELQPPAAASLSSIPLKVVEQDNGVIKRIELKAIAEGRSAKDLWQKWTSTRHVTGGPGVSITDFETLVSASQNARWLGTTVDADEIVFSLPEGSEMRAEFFGDKVEVKENGNKTSVVVTNGKVILLDQGGVVRAWASADAGAEQTIADVSFQQQEFVLRLKAKRLVEDPKFMPNMQCATFPETGAAKDEEQSPHGAVRYEVKEEKEKREFLLRISWRYDVDRIRLEAESTVGSQSSSSLQPSTMNRSAHGDHPAERKSAPLALPGSGNSVLKEVPTVRSANVVKAVEDWGPADPKTGLRLRLILAESSVPAGKPVLGKLELRNSGKDAAKYDPQSFAPFRVVQIFDEKGNPASFIGPRPQTSGSAQQLAAGESVILWENVDLSELYLLDSGNYEVAVVFIDRQRELALESGSVRLKVDGGQLAPKLQLLKQLREFAPADWSVSTSFGAIYLSHSPTNLKQDVTTIQLWFTDEPLPADYKLGEGEEQQQIVTIASTELGLLHLAAPKQASELWPAHELLIKTAAARVLSFRAKPDTKSDNKLEKEKDSNDQVKELPWRAKGRVTDREGKPLAGVSVRAHCGFGSLMPTGEAVTNAEGNYELQFGPGGFSQNRQLVQAATISVSLDGHFEQNLHRQGDLIAALEKSEGEDLGWGGKTIKDLFLPGEPKTIDFVMLPATKLKGVIIGKDGDRLDGVRVSLTGPDLPPSCSVVAQTQTDKGGRFELTNLPTGFVFQLLIEAAKKQSPRLAWASPPLKLDPFERGHNCFSTEYKGRKQSWHIQDFFIKLEGDGLHWKDALVLAADEEAIIAYDGMSTDDLREIFAKGAQITLGTDRVPE